MTNDDFPETFKLPEGILQANSEIPLKCVKHILLQGWSSIQEIHVPQSGIPLVVGCPLTIYHVLTIGIAPFKPRRAKT